MSAELGTAMHNAMPNSHWRGGNLSPDCCRKSREGDALRLENTLLRDQRVAIGRTNVQAAVAVSDAIGASRQQRLFVACPAGVDAELQRGRTTIERED